MPSYTPPRSERPPSSAPGPGQPEHTRPPEPASTPIAGEPHAGPRTGRPRRRRRTGPEYWPRSSFSYQDLHWEQKRPRNHSSGRANLLASFLSLFLADLERHPSTVVATARRFGFWLHEQNPRRRGWRRDAVGVEDCQVDARIAPDVGDDRRERLLPWLAVFRVVPHDAADGWLNHKSSLGEVASRGHRTGRAKHRPSVSASLEAGGSKGVIPPAG